MTDFPFQELVETEKSFLRDMHNLHLHYQLPLQERLSQLNHTRIFGNLIEVIVVSTKLANDLQPDCLALFDHCQEIEKVYSTYCSQSELAIQLAGTLEKDKNFKEFFTSANENSKSLGLSSLLLKPVQRVLKYPLLIRELEKTRRLDGLYHLYSQISAHINTMKKRVDFVTHVKRNDISLRNGISKKIERSKVQIKGKLGLAEIPQNEHFNSLIKRYDQKHKNIISLKAELENFVSHWNMYIQTIEQFNTLIKMNSNKFEDFMRSQILHEISELLNIYQSPLILMKKRENKLLDFQKNDRYLEITQQLFDELPILMSLTSKRLDLILEKFQVHFCEFIRTVYDAFAKVALTSSKPLNRERPDTTGYVQVLYDYKAQRPDELDLKVGDLLKIVHKHESGWWIGNNGKYEGLFPSNYAKEV